MIDLILIILLIVSLFKPDVLLSKKVKEKANDEQKQIITKNLRKIYSIFIATMESLALARYNKPVSGILAVICIILIFTISLPASKENKKITNELN